MTPNLRLTEQGKLLSILHSTHVRRRRTNTSDKHNIRNLMAETNCSQRLATSAYITEMADYRKAGEHCKLDS